MHSQKLDSINPATRWEDAFPTGNGSTGVLVYGNICRDTIILNHEALWIPSSSNTPPNISENLAELREMLLHGEYAFADRFLDIMLQEKGFISQQSNASYHPAGELLIQTESNIPFTDYHRELDLSTGLITISWNEQNVKFSRQIFVSRSNDFICIRLNGDSPKNYHLILQPRSLAEENRAFGKKLTMEKIPIDFQTRIEKNCVVLSGKYTNNEYFCSGGKIIQCDGTLSQRDNVLLW